MKFNVALYIRLSREDGDNLESESIVNQRKILHLFLEKHKELNYVNEYVDDGFTGSNFNRPAWKKLMMDVKNKQINTIVTKDLSRMGRDYISMGEYIERLFPENNIRYIALNDDIDTFYETPGLEFLQFKLVFNDYYLKDTSKKIKKVIRAKKEKGEFLGWKAIYGYKKSPSDKYKIVIDEKVKPIIKRMFALALEGKSPRQIARIFTEEHIKTPSSYAGIKNSTIWCPRTIEEILTNETYIGNLTQGKRRKLNYKSKKEIRVPKENWIITKNTHEAIIDKKVFETVGELLKKNKNKVSGNNIKLLSGFMWCKECGHKIGINKSSDGKRYYCHCNYYTANSKYGLCTPHSLNYQKLELIVLGELKKMIKKYVDCNSFIVKVENFGLKNNLKTKTQKEINNLTNKINTNTLYVDKIYEDKLKENIDIEMFNRLTEKYRGEINIWQTEKKELERKLNNFTINNEDILVKINEYLSLKKITRNLLVNLIDKIIISEDKIIEIHYKFKLY